VPRFWELLHEKGYTPKATAISVRGEVSGTPGTLQLKVTGTNDILNLVPDPKNAAGFNEAAGKVGQSVVIQGVMTPGKDLKALAPLQVKQVK